MTIACAITVLLLCLSSTGGSPGRVLAPLGPPRATNRTAESVGSGILAQAERSLLSGAGPASGHPVYCSSHGYTSASCTVAAPQVLIPQAQSPFFASEATPSARFGASLAQDSYSPLQSMLFGGASSLAPIESQLGAQGVVHDDTWTFNSRTDVWTNVTRWACPEGTPCPGPRHDASIAWDGNAKEVIMFGGCAVLPQNWTQNTPNCESAGILGDTWEWLPTNSTSGTWHQVPVGGVMCGGSGQPSCGSSAPAPRFAAGLSYVDGSEGLDVVLFGGCGSSGDTVGNCTLGDTWEFVPGLSPGTGAWTQVGSCGGPNTSPWNQHPCARGSAPAARYATSMSVLLLGSGYHALLFGGCGGSEGACNSTQGSTSGLLGDTWGYISGIWSQFAPNCGGPGQPSCSVAPSPRYFASMAGAYNNSDVCLFGGTRGAQEGGTIALGGLYWIANTSSSSWSYIHLRNSSGQGLPPPRFDEVIIPGDECVGSYLFGGTSQSGGSLGDAWTDQSPYGNWALVSPIPSPPPVYGASLAYDGDPNSSTVVMFGGCGMTCPSNDTWVYFNCTISVECGMAGPAANAWEWVRFNESALCSIHDCPPPARFFASLAADSPIGAADNFVLFGGRNATTVFNDTWTLDVGLATNHAPVLNWTKQTVTGPPARSDAVFASGPGFDLLFGGNNTTAQLNDTWKWIARPTGLGGRGGWARVSGRSPAARSDAAMTYDSHDGYFLLFGGMGSRGNYLSDTWTFTTSWSELRPVNSPTGRTLSMMAYNSTGDYAFLYGGFNNTSGSACMGGVCGDTWEFTNGAWTNLSPTCLNYCPLPEYSGGISFAASLGAKGAIIMQGGIQTLPSNPLSRPSVGSLSGDLYAFGGGEWLQDEYSNFATNSIPVESTIAPSQGDQMVFDQVLGKVILIANCLGFCPNRAYTETWEYWNGAWAPKPLLVGESILPAMFEPGLVYATGSGVVFLFSWNSTFELNPQPPFGEWSRITPVRQPTVRVDSAVAYDSTLNDVVLFGGCTLPSPSAPCIARGDTWIFSMSNSTWWQVNGTNPPPPRGGAGFVYEPSLNDLVLFDGSAGGPAGAPITDEWILSPSHWSWAPSKVKSSGLLPGRWDASVCYDPTTGLTLVFGGFVEPGIVVNEAWVMLSNGTFLKAYPNNSGLFPGPAPRARAAIAWVPWANSMGAILLFGGAAPGLPGYADLHQTLGTPSLPQTFWTVLSPYE